jgi:hypothetical protein
MGKLDAISTNSSSSTCAISFTQINPHTSGASVGSTSMPNPSAQPVFSDASQVLQRTLDCESQAKGHRSFPRGSEKPRSEHHVNTIKHSSKPSNDEEVDKMRCATLSMSLSVIGFLITCCKRNKINYQVVMSNHHRNSSKSMCIINDIILIVMLLTIAIFSIDRFNRP